MLKKGIDARNRTQWITRESLLAHQTESLGKGRRAQEERGHSRDTSRPVVSVEITTTEQAKVESCFIVPSSNWLGGHPFKVEIGVRVSVG